MIAKTISVKDINAYIDKQPENVRGVLEKFRQTIRKAAPGAEETISYQMPAFKYHGMLVYFAAWKNHIGFYPISSGIKEFKKELSAYEVSKGTIKFPIDKAMPFGLISKIVKFRVNENLEKAKSKIVTPGKTGNR